MFVNQLPQLIWRAALLSTCLFAFWKGRWPERSVAVCFLLASFSSPLVLNTRDWLDPQWGVLIVDGALLVALLIATLRTNRVWILFATAFQLLSVVIHVAMAVDHSVAPLPYRRGLVIWSYMTLVALAVGTWQVSRKPLRPD